MSANPDTAAPTGRNKPAQGKERSDAALNHASQNTSSPEWAKQLPRGWKHVRLGDIAQTTSGGTPRRDKPQYYGGTIPWVKSGELGDRVVYETSETLSDEGLASSNAKVFPKGTLCIALYGATVGKLGILGVDAATNQAVCAIFPPEGLDTPYLYRFFEGKRRDLIEQGKGGAQSNISQGIIRDTMFPLPPLPEQRRIVAEIEKQFTRLEAGVAALRRVQANLKRYRAAVLKAACEGRLVATEAALARCPRSTKNGPPAYETGEALLARILTERRAKWEADQLSKLTTEGSHPKNDKWKARYKEPDSPDTSSLPVLPEGWVWVELGQLAWSVKDGPHYSPKYATEGVPFISGGNIRPSGVDFDNAKRITAELHAELSKRCKPEVGDILYTKGGTTGIARVNTYAQEFNVWVHVAVLKLVDSVHRFYVQHTLNSPLCYAQAQKFTHGVGNQDLGLTRMIRITVALPPLAEQTRIVAEVERRLSVVEELESVVTANLQRATRLRQSILQKAFTGELI